MQQHLHRPRGLLHRRFLYRIFEPVFLHRVQKNRRFVAARVGEQRLPARRENFRHEVGEGSRVLPLVEYVRGENEVEASQAFDIRGAPVEEERVWL